MVDVCGCFFFFFNDTATTEIYTLSLHDALPISSGLVNCSMKWHFMKSPSFLKRSDRKSTRLNSSHLGISYAVFCLQKKITPLAHPTPNPPHPTTPTTSLHYNDL